ncbi:MAG: hypothetical protein PHG65_00520 [Kiritimatiellae bacterium]|nr:hypothetical protein [Kiritimatiellia bacterium]
MRNHSFRQATLRRSGSTVIFALIMIFIAAGTLTVYMRYTIQNAHMTRRVIDTQKARMVAEAGLEYAELKLKEKIFQYSLGLPFRSQMQAVVNAIPTPMSPDPTYQYMTPTGGSAFKITVEGDVLYDRLIADGTACRGLRGDVQYFTIRSGAYNPSSGAGSVFRLKLQAVGVYLIRYALFYQDDLEIWPGPDMYITGPTHANSDMYIGCNASLIFSDRVCSAGNIYNFGKDGRTGAGNVRIVDGNQVPQAMNRGSYRLDSTYANWINQSLNLWDANVLSQEHGIQTLRPPVDADSQTNLHDLIERPLTTNSAHYSIATEAEKFANKATIFIHIDSHNNIWATNRVKTGTNSWSSADISTNFQVAYPYVNGSINGTPSFLKTNGYYVTSNGCIGLDVSNFYDDRENSYMAPVDIYLDEFLPIITNSANPDFNFGTNDYSGLIYVTRDPPASGSAIPCVRLRNGKEMATDLSVVTDLPLYVEGNFNSINTKASLVAGDAVTLLSSDWQDARTGAYRLNQRRAVNTAFFTIIMTGNTPTIGSSYNGGVENVLRFLEDWGGITTYYRGSIIDLWYSEIAATRWNDGSGGSYYSAPRRDWGYDEMYRTNCPPGMTRVFGMEELNWEQVSWDVF